MSLLLCDFFSPQDTMTRYSLDYESVVTWATKRYHIVSILRSIGVSPELIYLARTSGELV